jgi:phospholipid/cholesterol/gamma-HCH transport system substrate-binding protein
VKSFRDRNPIVIGISSIAILAIFVAGAFAVGLLHVLEKTYTVRGVFNDAAGIRGGDDVRVAGVKAGRVVKVQADHVHGHVIIEFKVNHGVQLGPQTSAEVALQTLLGTKFLRLSGPVHAPYLEDTPASQRVIPVERTKTPFDVFELTTVGTRSIQKTDTEKLNQLIGQLANITEGKQQTIRQLVDGISRFSTALTDRDAQLRELLDRADRLSALLDEKDQTVAGLIDQSQAVLDLVTNRRQDIVRGLQATNTAIGELSGILTAHKTQVDLLLDTLHPTVDILDRHQADLDRTLTWFGLGALGLSKAASHGPWADVYVRDIQIQLVGLICNTFQPGNPACA